MNGHRSLGVWDRAGDLIREIYGLVRSLPKDERFAIGLQLKRAAWSVENNLAEGIARRGHAELRRFSEIALASLAEVDSMVATLETVCTLEQNRVARIEVLRRQITAGALALCRRRPMRGTVRASEPEPVGRPSSPASPTPPTSSQHLVP